MARRITILGGGQSACERRWDMLRYVENTELWSLNNMFGKFSHIAARFDRWFELHSWPYLRKWAEEHAGHPDYFGALASLRCSVYCTQPLPFIPRHKQVVVDWVAVCDHLDSNYFLGSPSMMLMLALFEHDHGQKVERIQSYGIDTNDPQHGQQRQSWSYWIRACVERGIEIGGTMSDFMREPERDKGLEGLRESIGDAVMRLRARRKQEQQQTEVGQPKEGAQP